MARIAILTPDPGDPDFHGRWRDVLEREAAPLRRAGHAVEGRAWTEAGDLAAFDLVLPLLVWGYHREQDRWLALTETWEGAGVRLRNSAPVLRWNAEKTYLGRLAERGAPVVPTLYVDRVDQAALADASARFGVADLVAKPVASASAFRTIRWPRDPVGAGPQGKAMIQPYLASIESSGEVSLLFFGGAYSHAVRKVPQPGDFRVQPEYDGVITRHDPSEAEMAAARAILAAVGEPLLYVRIDLVVGRNRTPELIELEAIEPDLYLGYDPAEGARFADAVGRAIG
jgi:glutathione synthase/RimK-type ligase-like ATP-grasp enzyme